MELFRKTERSRKSMSMSEAIRLKNFREIVKRILKSAKGYILLSLIFFFLTAQAFNMESNILVS